MEFIGFTVNIGFLLLKFQKIINSGVSNGKNNDCVSIFTTFASCNLNVKRKIMTMVSVIDLSKKNIEINNH